MPEERVHDQTSVILNPMAHLPSTKGMRVLDRARTRTQYVGQGGQNVAVLLFAKLGLESSPKSLVWVLQPSTGLDSPHMENSTLANPRLNRMGFSLDTSMRMSPVKPVVLSQMLVHRLPCTTRRPAPRNSRDVVHTTLPRSMDLLLRRRGLSITGTHRRSRSAKLGIASSPGAEVWRHVGQQSGAGSFRMQVRQNVCPQPRKICGSWKVHRQMAQISASIWPSPESASISVQCP